MFRGEAGSDAPDVAPGDLIFLLEQKEHKDFKRIGSDLFYEKKVGGVGGWAGWAGWVGGCRWAGGWAGRCSRARPRAVRLTLPAVPPSPTHPLARAQVSLVDALCGCHFQLSHLDDRVLDISSDGAVIKPDAWMMVKVRVRVCMWLGLYTRARVCSRVGLEGRVHRHARAGSAC